MVLIQTRNDMKPAEVGDIADTSLAMAGLGDIRLRPKFQVANEAEHWVNVAVIPNITLPTGVPKGSYLGEKNVTFTPEVIASKSWGQWRALSALGTRFRESSTFGGLRVSHEMTVQLAGAYRFNVYPVEVGMTVNSTMALTDFVENVNQNPLEVLAGAQYQLFDYLQLHAGAGMGIVAGYGAPDARLFVGARYIIRDNDKDKDGILNPDDACLLEPEDLDGFEDGDGCPELDNDNDQILDPDDRCPLEPGKPEYEGCPPPDTDEDGVIDPEDNCPEVPGETIYQGCPPPDQDKDGILDADDTCPEVAGIEAFAGCPDTDADGIPDSVDGCPEEPETFNGVTDDDGCPDTKESKIKITKENIVILDKVQFATNSSVIQSSSHAILNQVTDVLKKYLRIKKIQIEGHTDSRGAAKGNLALSDVRAKAVMQYLVDHGIEAERMVALGFGETQPISTNDTLTGRSENRRVVFKILEQEL